MRPGFILLALAVLYPMQSTGAEAGCQCMANGRTYELGETICFNLPDGRKRARCDRVLNNTSWTVLQDECPSALLQPTPGGEKPEALAQMSLQASAAGNGVAACSG